VSDRRKRHQGSRSRSRPARSRNSLGDHAETLPSRIDERGGPRAPFSIMIELSAVEESHRGRPARRHARTRMRSLVGLSRHLSNIDRVKLIYRDGRGFLLCRRIRDGSVLGVVAGSEAIRRWSATRSRPLADTVRRPAHPDAHLRVKAASAPMKRMARPAQDPAVGYRRSRQRVRLRRVATPAQGASATTSRAPPGRAARLRRRTRSDRFELTGGRTRPVRDGLRIETLLRALPAALSRRCGSRPGGSSSCAAAMSLADLVGNAHPARRTRVLVADLLAEG